MTSTANTPAGSPANGDNPTVGTGRVEAGTHTFEFVDELPPRTRRRGRITPAADKLRPAQASPASPDAGTKQAIDDQAGVRPPLDEVEALITRYVAFSSPHDSVVAVLWTAHTWALRTFDVTPRLILDSPELGCPTDLLLELLELLCPAAQAVISPSAKALHRSIEAAGEGPPVILIDQADTVFGSTGTRNADLRAMISSSYRRGRTTDPDGETTAAGLLRVFAPIALAGPVGSVPAAIGTCGITVSMRPPGPGEHTTRWRYSTVAEEAAKLRGRLQEWAKQNRDRLRKTEPAMPDGVRGRAAEIWGPLLASAECAGGQWPDRARAACRYLTRNAAELPSPGRRLLADIKIAFAGTDKMFTGDLVEALIADPRIEWTDKGLHALDARRLARQLRGYGVHPCDIRIGEDKKKGYVVNGPGGLAQAWDRYPIPNTGGDDGQHGSVADDKQPAAGRGTTETPEQHTDQQDHDDVADVADVAAKTQAPNGSETSNEDDPDGSTLPPPR